jgi:hydroxylysine kinase
MGTKVMRNPAERSEWVTERDIARWCAVHFGIEGAASRLTGEVDLNFRIDAVDGKRFVAKLAAADEQPVVLAFQTEALAYAWRSNPALPIPQPVRGSSLETVAHVVTSQAETRLLRLLTWQEGAPLHSIPRNAATRAATGDLAARLTLALSGFSHPAENRLLLWDMKQAEQLQQKSDALPASLRKLIHPVFETVLFHFLPEIRAFPAQIIHNDLNLHNLLMDPDDHGIVSGCLDFGDMVRSPRICDLAIAAFYQADPLNDLVGSIGEMAQAYALQVPLRDDEWRWLVDLAAMRAVMTLVIANWRARLAPENAPYLLRNEPAARAFLEAYAGLSEQERHNRLLDESRRMQAEKTWA